MNFLAIWLTVSEGLWSKKLLHICLQTDCVLGTRCHRSDVEIGIESNKIFSQAWVKKLIG